MKKDKRKYSSPEMERLLKAVKKRGERLRKASIMSPEKWRRQFTI